MMHRFRNTLFLLLFTFTAGLGQPSIPPVGQWRDFLPYRTAIAVASGDNKIWCATPYSLFSVDLTEHSIDRFSKINGLSEAGINTIAYDQQTGKLLVAYSSSNIDILYRNDIINVPGVKQSGVQADKSIYNVYPYHGDFYLSSGLGVIVINGDKYEVKDTWVMGNGGSYSKVNSFTADNHSFYAATTDGLKEISITGSNPADFNSWQLISGTNGLPAGECKAVITLGNRVMALANDSLFVQENNNWDFFSTSPGWEITHISASEGKVFICEEQGISNRIKIYDVNGVLLELIQQGISQPADALSYQGDYWMADKAGSLLKYSSGNFESFRPASPDSVATGQLIAADKHFYAAAGSVNNHWVPLQNKNGVYRYYQGDWNNFNLFHHAGYDSLQDIICLAQDPLDASLWAGSYGGGLAHIKNDNSLEIYKQNSSLQPSLADPFSYRVAGLAFDSQNNLWISNYGAAKSLKVRKADGNWQSFSIPFVLSGNAVGGITIDDYGFKWIVSPTGNGLICFDDNHTIDDLSDDRWRLYRAGVGVGNLPASNVLCTAGDRNGFIWVGTSDGIAVIQCSQEVFTPSGCDAVWPIVPQGNFAGYLFKGEEVRSIAVDGADRKWVATAKGVFLISPEGEQIIYNFTEENSPLLSNDVRSIAVDGSTGEVFFGTSKGICSFRSTATAGQVSNNKVLVFPNPVPPGYGGTIAIKGLVENAVIKITELDGRLVYQTRALGGQAVWDGKDYRGRRISTGVYLVLISDDSRKEKMAAKIVFISK